MKIVIVGGGEVGFYLAKTLSAENHDIILLEKGHDTCKMLQEQLDVFVIQDNGGSISALKQAGIENADIFVAVTNVDCINILSCTIASKIGNPVKIARVKDEDFLPEKYGMKSEDFGVDLIIHPEVEAAKEIVNLVKRSQATDVIEFAEGKVQLIGLKMDRRDSTILGKKFKQVSQEVDKHLFRIVAVYRNGKTIIPTGEDYIVRGDQVFVISKVESIPDILKLMGKEEEKLEYVMILGAGLVGVNVAKLLEEDKNLSVKLLEDDPVLANEAAEVLESSLVVRGHAKNIDLMAAEGIQDMDCFIATSIDDEDNLISCLVAKHIGVRKAIALVNKSEYIPLISAIGLDSAISKKMTTINTILRYIRRGQISSISTIKGIDAELLEFNVPEGAKISDKPLKDVNFPEGAIIGMIVRDGEAMIPTGDTKIYPGDTVIVFSLPWAIHKLEKLFI
ncbi:Trk system potassium transporter TrkA [candidate division KSB1 bacterium]